MMGLAGRFEVSPSPLDESSLQKVLSAKLDCPKEYTQTLAQEKAKALAETRVGLVRKPTLVLGSDTIVDLSDHILEKPIDEAEAVNMLRKLSGIQHAVHTGVALYRIDPDASAPMLCTSFVDTAIVSFATISEEDIAAYVATGEPMDKAGSYGIQGLGGQFVSSVQGDFFTVSVHDWSDRFAK